MVSGGRKTYIHMATIISGALAFLFDHPLVIHFIHRNLAYLITALDNSLDMESIQVAGNKALSENKMVAFISCFVTGCSGYSYRFECRGCR